MPTLHFGQGLQLFAWSTGVAAIIDIHHHGGLTVFLSWVALNTDPISNSQIVGIRGLNHQAWYPLSVF
jgi:hypothetical protein